MRGQRGGYYRADLSFAIAQFDFSRLKNRTVLVTGASGMIGGCVADLLLMLNEKLGYSMNVYLNARRRDTLVRRYGEENEHMHFVAQDVAREFHLGRCADVIIHAASGADPASFTGHPVDVMCANILGTKNLLELLRAQGSGKLLYVSSGEVYGDGADDVQSFDEDYSGYVNPLAVRSCYPSSKRAAETMCVSYSHQYGTDAVIARPCHTYGQTMTASDNRASSEFLRRGARGEAIALKSAGSQVRNYCYAVDMATGILLLCCEGETGKAYNIAPENAIVSIRQLAEKIAKIAECGITIAVQPSLPANPIHRGVLISKRIQALGWRPLYSLDESIKHVIEDLKEQGGTLT